MLSNKMLTRERERDRQRERERERERERDTLFEWLSNLRYECIVGFQVLNYLILQICCLSIYNI